MSMIAISCDWSLHLVQKGCTDEAIVWWDILECDLELGKNAQTHAYYQADASPMWEHHELG